MRSDDGRLMKLPEVLHVTALSRSTVYRKMSSGDFPPQVRVGQRAVAWRERDVVEWLESRPRAPR